MLTLYRARLPMLRPWFAPMRSSFEDFFPELHEDTNLFPRVDITREQDNYKLIADFPGMNADDVHVEVKDGVLTLWGEKKSEKEQEGDGYSCKERYYGSFSRSFCLPAEASVDTIEAKMDKGVLTVTIPISGGEESKKIEIATA